MESFDRICAGGELVNRDAMTMISDRMKLVAYYGMGDGMASGGC